jgi:hypothetical protein
MPPDVWNNPGREIPMKVQEMFTQVFEARALRHVIGLESAGFSVRG